MNTKFVIQNRENSYYSKSGWIKFIRSALQFNSVSSALSYQEVHRVDGEIVGVDQPKKLPPSIEGQ